MSNYVTFVESRKSVLSAERFCQKNDISYEVTDNLTDYFLSIREEVLVMSAANRYLFPQKVISKPNLTIINYHGALLPQYPGRNAEAWAIYHQEKYAGITWLYVTKDVDAGDIIIQKRIPLTPEMTSMSLLKLYAGLAKDALSEVLGKLLNGTAVAEKQDISAKHPIKYSWEKPNDGVLDLTWSAEKISAFLRAIDYGVLHTLGIPRLLYCDEWYDIERYDIQPNDSDADYLSFADGSFDICRGSYHFILSTTTHS